MYPVCEITIDGSPVSSVFSGRLISCEVADKEGLSSDSFRAVLLDSPPARIPEVRAVVACRMGFGTRLYDMGEFIIDEIEVDVLPGQMTISAKAVDVGGKAKENMERHWDDASIDEIVADVAGDLGLGSSVDPVIGSFVYEWIGMQGESPIHFLERLAGRHGALFTVKAQTLIFSAKGAGTRPDGTPLTILQITPAILKTSSLSFRRSSRTKYGKVIATYMDRGQAKRIEVEVESQSEEAGDATYRINEPMASEAEARAAAEAKAADLARGELTFRAEIIGDATARAGAPVVFRGCRIGMDGREFIVSDATHRWSKNGGYMTTLAGTQKV